MGIRDQLLRDNQQTIESRNDFGVAGELIAPDGTKQDKSALDDTRPLAGRLTYSNIRENMDGNEVVCRNPTWTLSIPSLVRVPQSGENWIARVPPFPGSDTLSDYTLERPPLISHGLGRCVLYLEIVEQSEE